VPQELMIPPRPPAGETAPRAASAPPAARTPAAAKAPPAVPAPKARARPGADDVVLVTGFEPFGGDARNPSWEICERLPGSIAGLRVEVQRVPCEFLRSIQVVAEAIERHRPALVVCLGLAGGRAQLSVERVAINTDDARIPDNAGERPIDEPIAPVKAMVAAMRKAGVPAEVSNSAGTYVCNHLMYGVLHFIAASGKHARAGFIHVPYAEDQTLEKPGTPAMALATMVKGVEAAIAAAQATVRDVKLAAGTRE
jgi:pyroglutamyl-peptidase